MVDRDDGVPRGAARDAPADFMAVFGGARFVVLVTRRGVFGGDGKAPRMARDLGAVAAGGADIDFLCGIG